MSAQRLLCLVCMVWLGAAANIPVVEREVRELAENNDISRVIRPVIPHTPPARSTNAHIGVDMLDENTAEQDQPLSKQISSSKLKRRPYRRVRQRRPESRLLSSRQMPEASSVNYRFARKIVEGTLSNVRGGARLISARGNFDVPLVNKLIDNATLIRENIVEGFSCEGKIYGYYADQLNECQIFHICVPMKQMFPNRFTDKDVYHFSFICPKYTIFSQDSMVCAWSQSAVPCSEAHHLYDMNKNFFVVSNDVPKEPYQGGASGYPSPGGLPASTSPFGVPSPYPVPGGASINPALPTIPHPSPYPVPGVTPVNPALAPSGIPPAYPTPGGAPVNTATGGNINPAPPFIPAPSYPVSGVAPVNPAIPASTGGANPAPSLIAGPPVYPTGAGLAVAPAPSVSAPLPNSRPLGEGGPLLNSRPLGEGELPPDVAGETTLAPEANSVTDASS